MKDLGKVDLEDEIKNHFKMVYVPNWFTVDLKTGVGKSVSRIVQTFLSNGVYNWATSWENLTLPYANNKGADQPAHLCSLISAFVIHCLDSIISVISICKISSLASPYSCAGQFVLMVANCKDRFSCDEAQLRIEIIILRFHPVMKNISLV